MNSPKVVKEMDAKDIRRAAARRKLNSLFDKQWASYRRRAAERPLTDHEADVILAVAPEGVLRIIKPFTPPNTYMSRWASNRRGAR